MYEKRIQMLRNIDSSVDWEIFLNNLNEQYEKQEEAYKNQDYKNAIKKLHTLLPDYFKVFTNINKIYRSVSILPDYKKIQYDTGIFLVGFSLMPVILSVLEIKPKKVIFVPSRDTEFLIKVIVDAVKVTDPEYQIDKIYKKITIDDFSDPSKVFQEIDRIIEEHKNEYIAIDITGGKKTMIAGAFMASASSKNCEIYYVDFEEYDRYKGLPIPCTEFLAKLPNPSEIFSLADWERVESLFDNYQFRQVLDELNKIKTNIEKNIYYFKVDNNVPILKKIETIEKYAKAYECWDDFRYDEAFQYLSDDPSLRILKRIFYNNHSKDYEYKEREIYNDDELYATYIIDRYMNAERKKLQGQFQSAFLLFTSLAEFMITLWADLKYPPGQHDDLRGKDQKTGQLFGINFTSFLRACKTDSSLCSFLSYGDIKSLINFYMERNKLVLVHSTNTVKEHKANEAGKLILNIIKKHLNEKSPQIDIDNIIKNLRFKKFKEIIQ